MRPCGAKGVSAALAALDPALQDALPYLFGLLGIVDGADPLAQMDPQIKKQRTLDAIKRIVVRESLKQPLVVIFEDLHWIDEQTQALLDLLADSIANARRIATRQLSSRVPPRMDQQEPLRPARAQSVGPGKRRRAARGPT